MMTIHFPVGTYVDVPDFAAAMAAIAKRHQVSVDTLVTEYDDSAEEAGADQNDPRVEPARTLVWLSESARRADPGEFCVAEIFHRFHRPSWIPLPVLSA